MISGAIDTTDHDVSVSVNLPEPGRWQVIKSETNLTDKTWVAMQVVTDEDSTLRQRPRNPRAFPLVLEVVHDAGPAAPDVLRRRGPARRSGTEGVHARSGRPEAHLRLLPLQSDRDRQRRAVPPPPTSWWWAPVRPGSRWPPRCGTTGSATSCWPTGPGGRAAGSSTASTGSGSGCCVRPTNTTPASRATATASCSTSRGSTGDC
jgi:hypothetical protein